MSEPATLTVTVNLTEAHIADAIRDWMTARGFPTDAATRVNFTFTRGDRPHDSDALSASVITRLPSLDATCAAPR